MTSATALRVRTGWCLGSVILISVLSGCDGSDTEHARDDNYAQVRSGLPVRLDVLENDPNDVAVACVSPSNAGGYVELDPNTGEIRYTSPPGFVGTDRFHYVFQTSNGDRQQAEVRVRVDQLRDPGAVAKASDDIDALGIVDEVLRTEQLSVGVPRHIEPIPPSGDGIRAHRLQVRLEEGLWYAFRFSYSIERRPPFPVVWWEYPQAMLTDSSSVPLYDDLCYVASDVIFGSSWVCHSANLGANRDVTIAITPRDTQTYNLYLWSAENDLRNPNQSGDPYITCEELGPSAGCGYDALVETLDDNTGTRSNTQAVIGGSDVLGSIEREEDEDWFRVSVYATETITINVYPEAHPKEDALEGYAISLFTEDGLNLGDAVGTGGVASVTYAADTDTSLRLGVFPVADTGGYRVEVNGGDVPATTESTAVLKVGDTIDGRLSGGGDADWYQVYLEGGSRYVASVTTDLFEVRNPSLAFLDPRGEVMVSSTGDSENDICGFPCTSQHRLSFLPARTGFHFLSVGAPVSGQAGLYELEFEEHDGSAPGDDFAGDDSTVGRSGGYYPVAGQLEQENDEDWFAFYSVAGDRRTFYVDGIDEGGDAVEGVLISVVDQRGLELATSEPWLPGIRVVEFAADAAGDYFLKVEGEPGVTASYIVHADIGDAPADPNTWAYVGPGGEVLGNNQGRNEGDWYRAHLPQGRTFEVRLEGIDRGFGPVEKPVLQLFDPDGAVVREARGNDGAATMMVVADTPEPYLFGAYNFAITRGDYRLSIVEPGKEACAP